MPPFRIVFLAGCTATLLGSGWLAYSVVWGEDAQTRAAIGSVRAGSGGNGFGNSSVK